MKILGPTTLGRMESWYSGHQVKIKLLVIACKLPKNCFSEQRTWYLSNKWSAKRTGGGKSIEQTPTWLLCRFIIYTLYELYFIIYIFGSFHSCQWKLRFGLFSIFHCVWTDLYLSRFAMLRHRYSNEPLLYCRSVA